jgi:hypothetical protein
MRIRKSCLLRSLLILGALALVFTAEGQAARHDNDPYHLKPDKKGNPILPVQFGLLATTRGASDLFTRGWGGSGFAELTSLSPVVVRLGFSFSSANVKSRLFPEVAGSSTTFDLAVHFEPTSGRVRPFAGGGLTYVYNTAPGEPPDQYVAGGYESGAGYAYKLGSGFGSHIRSGLSIKLSALISLTFDLKWQEVRPEITYTVTEFPSGRQHTEVAGYDFSALYISIGVIVRVRDSS